MGYSQVTGMSSTRFPLKGLGGCGCQSTSGLGQADPSGWQVSVGWKYATFALGALVVGQFFWWDSKAPQVLRGGGYFKRNRRRSHRRR
jgi:hypothetical protein